MNKKIKITKRKYNLYFFRCFNFKKFSILVKRSERETHESTNPTDFFNQNILVHIENNQILKIKPRFCNNISNILIISKRQKIIFLNIGLIRFTAILFSIFVFTLFYRYNLSLCLRNSQCQSFCITTWLLIVYT